MNGYPRQPSKIGVPRRFNDWSGAIKNKLADEVDIPGFNYKPMKYEQILKEHPQWIIFGVGDGVLREFARGLPFADDQVRKRFLASDFIAKRSTGSCC